MIITSTCAVCGTEFEYERQSRGRKRKCCSPLCYGKTHEVTCKQCGKVFRSAGRSKFCGMVCSARFKHSKGKPRTCKICKKVFVPERGGSYAFCSEQCKPKQPDQCAYCHGPMPPLADGQTRPMVYCAPVCKYAALKDRQRVKANTERQRKRDRLAKALRLWRVGHSLDHVAVACGYKRSAVSSHLLKSKAYARRTKQRKAVSKWHDAEATRNARSQEFRIEADFRQHAASVLSGQFQSVTQEVSIPGTRRKIDIVVSDGLFRFGLEIKNGNRTARLDQTLGQALVKCAVLQMIPCCVVPDDIVPDKVFMHGCKTYGAIAGTLTQVIQQMRATCSMTTTHTPQKVL